MEISDRIKLIIRYKSKNQKEFAEMMGWSSPYLSHLISEGRGIGLTPIMQLLEKFEDIDARWLLFGKGYIFGSIEQGLLRRVNFLLDLEKYIPVMNEHEIQTYLDAIQGKDSTLFADEKIKKWQDMLALKNSERDMKIYEAMRKNEELCKLKNQNKESVDNSDI